MTMQNPDGRYQVFSANDYHTRYPNVIPAARYDSLQDAITHAESVTYRMAIVDSLAESRGFIYCNWAPLKTVTLAEYNAIHSDFRGVWATERTDLPNWDDVREQYIGKRTMMSRDGTCSLLIEGLSFLIIDDTMPPAAKQRIKTAVSAALQS